MATSRKLDRRGIYLVFHSLAPSTRVAYIRSLKDLSVFSLNVYNKKLVFPLNIRVSLQFVAYLHSKKYKTSSIITKISAVGYFHKLFEFKPPLAYFAVQSALKGLVKVERSLDTRLPITSDLLLKIVCIWRILVTSDYDFILLKAMACLALKALLRVEEMTDSIHNLMIGNLSVSRREVIIKFTSFKHSVLYNPEIVIQTSGKALCAVQAVLDYLNLRGSRAGPLFVDQKFRAVKRGYFTLMVKKALMYLEYPPSLYNSHSFRIGGATEAMERGLSALQIQLMGRWKSQAFLKYIRNPRIVI